MTDSTAPTAMNMPAIARNERRGIPTDVLTVLSALAPRADTSWLERRRQPLEHRDTRRDGHAGGDGRDGQFLERVTQDQREGHDAEDHETDDGQAAVKPADQSQERADQEPADKHADLQRELVVGAEQRDHQVLGPGRLKADHERADGRDR